MRPWHFFRKYTLSKRARIKFKIIRSCLSEVIFPSFMTFLECLPHFFSIYGAYFLGYRLSQTFKSFLLPHSSLFLSMWAFCVSLNVSVYPEAFSSERRRDRGSISEVERNLVAMWQHLVLSRDLKCVLVSVWLSEPLDHISITLHKKHITCTVAWHTCIAPAAVFHLSCCHHVKLWGIVCHNSGVYHEIVVFAANQWKK